MVTALQALELLRQGNARFVADRERGARVDGVRRNELTQSQAPFAIVLGCSDSRVPAEIVFDQGLVLLGQALVRDAVRANVRASASQLRHGSEVLEQLIERDGLLVVGAEYSLETGSVSFFEGVPAGS